MIVKVRQDAWSHEDDLLLAESVLRNIRDGSTQLKAFDEVGDILNRTSAACGFRWNAEVRKKYIKAVDLAKRQRKDKKRAEAKEQTEHQNLYSLPQPTPRHIKQKAVSFESEYVEHEPSEMNLQNVITYLTVLKSNKPNEAQFQTQIDHLENENKNLSEQNNELKSRMQNVQEQLTTVKEDYQSFINIMERARQMNSLEQETSTQPSRFHMSQNSQLEQIIHESN